MFIALRAAVPLGIAGVWAYRIVRHLRARGAEAYLPPAARAAIYNAEHGMARAEHGIEDLPGTVGMHHKHLFVVTDEASQWPSRWEDTPGLPTALNAALKNAKEALKGRKVKLTAASPDGRVGDVPGDILVFPDGVRVRGVATNQVADVISWLTDGDTQRAGLTVQPYSRNGDAAPAQIFVCAHAARDKRCGVIGPALIEILRNELAQSGPAGERVALRACSHVGGHKYAGNMLVFSRGEGHWYGYVDARAAARIVRQHVLGGTPLIEPKLWRGMLGCTEEQQRERCSNACASCGAA